MDLRSRYRILLIDDMPSIHEDFREILTPDTASSGLSAVEHQLFGVQETAPPPAFVLDCAIGGEEGLELLKAAHLECRPYALAFVDMRMPAGWDGMRTIEELWAVDARLQVVICTAYSDEPLGQALPRLGSPDKLVVLKKPFDPIEVTQLARALVSKWRARAAGRRPSGQPESGDARVAGWRNRTRPVQSRTRAVRVCRLA